MVADSDKLTFRFRPRFRVLPWVCVGIGAALGVAAIAFDLAGASLGFALVCAALGPLLGVGYLAAPAWRFVVVVDDRALTVRHGERVRFRLEWNDVARVIASPSTRTLFLDGGDRARSLLVTGPGAPGPYRIERREALYDAIVARVPVDRVTEVNTIETWRPG